jgi:hypothetical protein
MPRERCQICDGDEIVKRDRSRNDVILVRQALMLSTADLREPDNQQPDANEGGK